MSKSEIKSWISSSRSITGDGGDNREWNRDLALIEWSQALVIADDILLTSRTKTRTQFLREELVPLAQQSQLSMSQILDLFKLLTKTYPRYIDNLSRDSVELVGMELIKQDELRETKFGVDEQIIGWLSNEAKQISKQGESSYAPADVFVLLSWSCGIYTTCLKHNKSFASSGPWSMLTGAMAALFDLLCNKDLHAKSSLRNGGMARIRRALRSAPNGINTLLLALVMQAKSSQVPLTFFPLIGVAIDVQMRLKNAADESLTRLTPEIKAEILSLYASTVLMSKSPVKPQALSALHDFIDTYVSQDDLSDDLLPIMEKALLRSPEYSLNAMSYFFSAYAHPIGAEILERLLTPISNCSKSNNAIVRTNAAEFFGTLVSKITDEPSRQLATTELLSLPKVGKTSGPDHRIVLYSMMAHLKPSSATSISIVSAVPSLIIKETHDHAISILSRLLPAHLAFMLRSNQIIPKDILSSIMKEMTNTKPALRRAFCSFVGETVWALDDFTPEAVAFSKSVLPSLDTNLKNALTNPLGAAGCGPLEGYISIAVMLGPLSRSGKLDEASLRDLNAQLLVGSAAKPSFLVWEKVYQKITDPVEERWLLRAIEAGILHSKSELIKGENRTHAGLVLIRLAVESPSPQIRQEALDVVKGLVAKLPLRVNRSIRAALNVYLAKFPLPSAKLTLEGEEDTSWKKHGRLSQLLLSCVSFVEETELPVRENELAEFVVVSHHPLVCLNYKQTWIELCQRADVDPHELTNRNLDKLIDIILTASLTPASQGFVVASHLALKTLAFVSPLIFLPRIIKQLQLDLDPETVNGLTDVDFGVWSTPAGTTFINVLTKKDEDTIRKGKDQNIAKWDAEVRKSLAQKKPAAPPTLSKQDQALVDAQLVKEAKIREKVQRVKSNLNRALCFIQSLVSSGVQEFHTHMTTVIFLLLEGALQKGTKLVGAHALQTYLDLSQCCSDRLGETRKWIGVATLRSLKVDGIPDELRAEGLGALLARVLYRLRALSEQTPFDASTFSYMFPLLKEVIIQGGISAEENDDPLEQVALALDIIKFHGGEFSNRNFPRKEALEIVLHVVRHQPKLTKEASSGLVDASEALHANASREETDVLIRGTLAQEVYVRSACLQSLQPFDLTDLDWSTELWIGCHDGDEQNERLARHLWEDNGLDVTEDYMSDLLEYLGHENAYVKTSAAAAVAEAVEILPQTIHNTMSILQDYYREKAKIRAPEYDAFGMVVGSSLDLADPWLTRVAIAKAFELLAPFFTENEVLPFFTFLIQDGALGDRNSDVRRGMLASGAAAVDLHGKVCLTELVSMFESHLAVTTPATEAADQTKEAVVILIGRVARHLNGEDERIPKITDRLVGALKTPAEQVQIAVSDCLAPLVKLIEPRLPALVEALFHELFGGSKYAARRGAAYGLAGVLKGTGIGGLKEFDVINRLRIALEEKGKYESRQGAMFAFETFSMTLGRLFEPYVTYTLPVLLSAFGDSVADVREAAQDAARVIMGNMSGYGVKQILPSLLSGLDEKQWRTKKGSIELLGMMAYCSPKQLSLSLPIVIPRLTGVLTDSHAQVKAAANRSLKKFGEVINNPEIKSLVPVLLKALVDPAKTPNALSSLLKTSFMHYIDHSSLALVIPVIERGLRERGADVKKKAVKIVGNLASLTDSKDFVPYLSKLLPLVHTVLVDPVPEARATAAKALGTLVERLGEIHFPDLVPGLLRTLKTDTSGVDRQGAAQGLSEVLSGLGMDRLESLLPDIIANAQSPRSTVREGFMSLLVYLPATFGTRFQPHLPKIIAPILSGLSDVEEYVREAAMRAGRMVVTNYSSKAIDLLLPELQHGMFDPSWRIRQSSITLVGELLFKVSGISGRISGEEEETAEEEVVVAESSRRALVQVLGSERRDRILSALYLVRQDGVNVVRQSSIQIWKALVQNTPKTVREILPELLNHIIILISGSDFEQQETAGRTIGDLSRKFGEKIIGEIVMILRNKSNSPDGRTREGVCLTLCEVIQNTTDTQREGYDDDIITMVRVSLVDEESDVRSAAAKAFDILQEHIGAKAIDQTIPTLLEALRQPGKGSGTALQALREVMSVRASTVFPVLIPTLIATPMTVFNARALASLVTVAGNALTKRLTIILGALVKTIEDEKNEELLLAVDEALRALLAAVADPEGQNTVMMILLGWAKHDSPKRRASACDLFAIFCDESDLDDSLYRVDWIRQIVSLLEDQVVAVHTAAWQALDTFIKTVPKDELEPLVVPLRRSIESTGVPGHHVPGFSLPKGVAPMVPVIIAGLTTGSNEQREQAAYAIGDLVERTEESAIKPFVVSFTGPLIRAATQASTYPPAVKTATLSALTSMLQHIPAFVKPFFPQLQRTFVKSASDPASIVVRNKAAQALGVLMKSQPRVDPVITELLTGAKGNDDEIASSLILAVGYAVRSGKANVGVKARESCVELISDSFKESHSDHYIQATAKLFNILSRTSAPELLKPIIDSYLLAGTPLSPICSHTILAVVANEGNDDDESETSVPNVFQRLSVLKSVAQKVMESVASDKPIIARPAREARDALRALGGDVVGVL